MQSEMYSKKKVHLQLVCLRSVQPRVHSFGGKVQILARPLHPYYGRPFADNWGIQVGDDNG